MKTAIELPLIQWKWSRRLMSVSWLALAVVAPGSPVVADEPNPYARADNTWITMSGTVESVRPSSFTLDYGKGLVVVEMDDGDRDADGYKLLTGDKVTVSGRIDDDFFERTTIEASSVYVENIGTTFFASAVDEEDPISVVTVTTPIEVSRVVVEGTVTKVKSEEFVIDTGLRELTVEVDAMPYDPLDDEGYQKIDVGDRVRVDGRIDDDLFEGRELVADSVITLDYDAS